MSAGGPARAGDQHLRLTLQPSQADPTLALSLDLDPAAQRAHLKPLAIGRAPGCDLVFNPRRPEKLISRKHCLLGFEPSSGQWNVKDNNSTNGILVNGVKVKEAALTPGDFLSFARGSMTPLGEPVVDCLAWTFSVGRAKRAAESPAGDGRPQSAPRKMARLVPPSRGAAEAQARDAAKRRRLDAEIAAKAAREALEAKKRVRIEREALEAKVREQEAAMRAADAERQKLREESERFRQQQLEQEKAKQQLQEQLEQLRAAKEAEAARVEQEARARLVADSDKREREMKQELEALQARLDTVAKEKSSLEVRLEEEQKAAEQQKEQAAELDGMKKLLGEKEKTLAELQQETSNGRSISTEMCEQFECSICAELFIKATTLVCSHTFCRDCIQTWLKTNKVCPVCRAPVTSEPVRTIALDQAVESIVSKMSKADQAERAAVLKERAGVAAPAAPAAGAAAAAATPAQTAILAAGAAATAAATAAAHVVVVPGRPFAGRTVAAAAAAAATEVIELSSDEEEEELEESEEEEEWVESEPSFDEDANYNYRGGHCFNCGRWGHWAAACRS